MISPIFSQPPTDRLLPRFALDWSSGVANPAVGVSRAGDATFIGADGLIKSAPQNTQRVDWSTGFPGLLIEEARTNNFRFSEDFSNAFWIKSRILPFGSGSIANDIISPDGTQNADLLTEDTSTGEHSVATNLLFNFVSGLTYTQSYFVKANGRTTLTAGFRSNWFGTSNVQFDLVAKTVTISPGSTASTSGTIAEFPGGWFRITHTATATATGSSPSDTFLIFTNPAGTASYTGDGISGLYVWGAQLEVGAIATSYIRTGSTTVTRNADVATITGADFSGFWRSGKGAALAKARPSTVSGIRPVLQFDDATADNIIALRGNAANPELYVKASGVDQAQIDAGTIAAGTSYRLAGAWAANDCAASFNSGAPVLDGVATIPTVTQARLGSDGTNYLNGHIEAIEYYDERVPSASLQVLSSQAGRNSIIGSVFRDSIIS